MVCNLIPTSVSHSFMNSPIQQTSDVEVNTTLSHPEELYSAKSATIISVHQMERYDIETTEHVAHYVHRSDRCQFSCEAIYRNVAT